MTYVAAPMTKEHCHGLLKCVRFAQEAGGGDNLLDLPPLETLSAYEQWLCHALDQIADLERQNRSAA